MANASGPVEAVWRHFLGLAEVGRSEATFESLSRSTGLDAGEIGEAVAYLAGEAIGLVEAREIDGRPGAGLTSLGKADLGLTRPFKDESTEVSATDVGIDPDQVAADGPHRRRRLTPEEAACRAEALERKHSVRRARFSDAELDPANLPEPVRIIVGVEAWNSDPVGEDCPACGSRPLPAATYCARCGAWGLDRRLERVWEAARRATAPETRAEAEQRRRRA